MKDSIPDSRQYDGSSEMRAELKEIFSAGEGLQLHLDIQKALDQLADLTVPQVGLMKPQKDNPLGEYCVNRVENLVKQPEIKTAIAKVNDLLIRVLKLVENNGIIFEKNTSNSFQEGAVLTAGMATKTSVSAINRLIEEGHFSDDRGTSTEIYSTANHIYSEVLLLGEFEKTPQSERGPCTYTLFRNKFGGVFRAMKGLQERDGAKDNQD